MPWSILYRWVTISAIHPQNFFISQSWNSLSFKHCLSFPSPQSLPTIILLPTSVTLVTLTASCKWSCAVFVNGLSCEWSNSLHVKTLHFICVITTFLSLDNFLLKTCITFYSSNFLLVNTWIAFYFCYCEYLCFEYVCTISKIVFNYTYTWLERIST